MSFNQYLIVALLTAGSVCAQTNGTIVGRVTDPSGSGLPNAKIELTNQNTGIKATATSSGQGEYVLPRVNPGTYQLNVSASGFKTVVRNDIPIQVNQTAREDFALPVGDVASSIQVEAELPVVQSETSSVGQVVDSAHVREMPLNGRDSIYGLLAMVPGVQDSGSNPMISGSAFRGGTSITVDGANGDDALNERINLPVPSLDSISEFKVLTNGSPAEFGKPAQVIVATKGGGNAIHGSLFEFNRNNVLAAQVHSSRQVAKPPYKRNEFGGSVGGPIRKNKLFYFGTFEGLRLVQYNLEQEAVPTPALKAGDFNGIANIKDPLNASALFPGNIIPASRISSVSQTLEKFYPDPNQSTSANGLGANNVGQNVSTVQPNDRYSGRVDYQISAKDTVNVRYFWANNGPYKLAAGSGILFGNWNGNGLSSKNLSSVYTRVLTPSFVNEFRFNINYWTDYRIPQNNTFNPNSIIPQDPVPQDGLGGLPTVTISNFATMSDQPGSADVNHRQSITDSLNWQKGKHTVKFGLSLDRISAVNRQNSSPYRGSFGFNGTYTSYAFADFLLGDMFQSSYTTSNFTMDDLNYRTAYFVQDDWRVNSKLTVNVGVRYEWESPWEKRNDLAYWSQSLNKIVVVQGNPVPAFQSLPTVSAQSLGVNNSNYIDLGKKNFAPRVGLAYRPFNTSHFVIRASYGIFYNPMSEYDDVIDARDLGLNPPFRATYSFTTVTGAPPSITWANPFPGQGTASGTANPSVYGITPNFHAGYEQNWNFTTEWEAFSHTVLRTTYLGSKGTHLPVSIDVNEPLPSPLPIQTLRPYQPWGDIDLYQSTRNDILNQLQVGVQHRIGHGLQFGFEYSFTKDLTPSYDGTRPYDPFNMGLDRGNNPMYSRNYIVTNYIYDLPIGRGKTVFPGASRRVDKFIGGWQLAGILTAASGHYVSITDNNTISGYLFPTQTPRANIVGNPIPDNQSQYEWYNPAAFAIPSKYVYGNSAPFSVQGPGTFNWDAALYKHTTITERIRLEIRMEAFNYLNHANLSSLQNNIANSQAGVTTGRSGSRIVEFGGRLTF